MDWPTAFSPITQEPKFCQIWDWWWNINDSISFHFELFPGKTDDKILEKIKKALFWGQFGPLRHFLNISIIYHFAKNQKKLITHSREKSRTDRQTGRQMLVILSDPLLNGGPKRKTNKNSDENVRWFPTISGK